MRSWLLLGGLVACATKGPESNAPEDGVFDTLVAPVDHGEIQFGAIQTATLTPDAEVHTWTFAVTGTVAIRAFTDLVPYHSGVDTVLYLYKRSAAGWGSYIARDDDDGRLEWSSIGGAVDAGEYRIVATGYSSTEHGGFELVVDCDGAGCAPATTCMFGATAAAIAPSAQLDVGLTMVSSPDPLSELDAQRVIAALHESTHTDVATVAAALAAVDQGTIRLLRLYDHVGARGFTAIEYTVSGNLYGAIFAGDTVDRVAAIHDSTLASCTVVAETCRLGDSYARFVGDLQFALESQRTITKATQLTGVAAEQALAALHVGYPAAPDLAAGLALVGPAGEKLLVLTNSQRTVEVYVYAIANQKYGEIFIGHTLSTAATIENDALYACSLLAP